MNNLKKKFEKALTTFVEKQKKNPHVIGILVTGSFVHSVPHKNSDLDVHIVLDESTVRERGNTWVNGVEIEYFMNPFEQVVRQFEKDYKRGTSSTAHMFTNSLIVYHKGTKIDELRKMAKSYLKKPFPKLSKLDVELGKYHLDDLEKDLEDMYLVKDEFACNQVAHDTVHKALGLFIALHRLPEQKNKRLYAKLAELDKKFAGLYKKAITSEGLSARYKAVRSLITYTEELLGGKRKKEWKLRSKL